MAWKYIAPHINIEIHIAARTLSFGIKSQITPHNSSIQVPILPRGSCHSFLNRATDSGNQRNLNGNVCKSITAIIAIAIFWIVRYFLYECISIYYIDKVIFSRSELHFFVIQIMTYMVSFSHDGYMLLYDMYGIELDISVCTHLVVYS